MNIDKIKKNAPGGAEYHHNESFYRYNQHERKYEVYMDGIGWVGVMLGSSTELKPL